MDSVISYLRIPILASTGIATVLSGVLYFKQKYAAARSMRPAIHGSVLTSPAQ